MLDNSVRIYIDIQMPGGERRQLGYSISAEQAANLYVGRSPPNFADTYSRWQYEQRMERARTFANYVATELADKLVKSLGPMEPDTAKS